MRKDWAECCFEDLLDYEQPTKYIVKSTKYNDSFKTPVLTAGKSFIKGYTNETDGIFNNLPTIIFDDFTTATQYVNFKFKVKSSAMKILVPTSKLVNMPFTYFAMQVNQVRSDTHKRYWISVFAKKKFSLPPLVEQKAIVRKIEALFSSLDSGIADLKRAQEQLKIYRQAVLKKAFEGELTKGVKPVISELNEISSNIHYGYTASSSKEEIGPHMLRITDIQDNNVNWKTVPFCVIEKNKINDYLLQKGDILFARTGATVGKSYLIKNKIPESVFASYLIRVQLKENILPEYIAYFFQSPKYWIQIGANSVGIGQPNVNGSKLKRLIIDYPKSKEEQHQIVQAIENRLSVCDKVEKDIADSLEKAQALRQSILKKAFEGTLLSEEEIAKCKADKEYEPASVLLERIKKEKNK